MRLQRQPKGPTADDSVASIRTSKEYAQALRRASVASQMHPGHGRSQATLALLQCRTGEFQHALLSAKRAVEIQQSQGPDAYAIRAVAYYRLRDSARAQNEAAVVGNRLVPLASLRCSGIGDENQIVYLSAGFICWSLCYVVDTHIAHH